MMSILFVADAPRLDAPTGKSNEPFHETKSEKVAWPAHLDSAAQYTADNWRLRISS
jgi:hypothetical protein